MDAELCLVDTVVGIVVLDDIDKTLLTIVVDNVIFDVGSPHLL